MKYAQTLALVGAVGSLVSADVQVQRRHSTGSSGHCKRGNGGHHCGGCAVKVDVITLEGIPLGLFPDDTSQGGMSQNTAEFDMVLGKKLASYGRYTQAFPDEEYSGLQLYAVLGQVIAGDSAFHISFMPRGQNYSGLLPDDDANAVSFCQHVQNITNYVPDVEVRLFHEMNYYMSDGEYNSDGYSTYPNDTDAYMAAHKHVYDTCKSIVPSVPLGWCPNIDTNTTALEEFWPGDEYADFVCMDYYPKTRDNLTFVDTFTDFYNRFASEQHPFVIGETGLHYNGTIADKLTWLDQIVQSSKGPFPLLKYIDWFNFQSWYDPPRDFRIVDPFLTEMTEALKEYINSGYVPPLE